MKKKTRNRPLWFGLIRRWVETGRGSTGLTLPFLVGAAWRESRHADGDMPDMFELTDLLHAFQSKTPSECFIKIAQCGVLRQPVASIYEGVPMAVRDTIELRGGTSTLCVESYPHNRDIDSAALSLWTLVGDAVVQGRFSYNQRLARYVPFPDDELAFIDETKSLLGR